MVTMALFDYKGTGDYFDVRQNLNAVIDEQKARDKAVIDNVEKYLGAVEEMEGLRGGVQSILSQYSQDEKGKLSDAAPKYAHDAVKAVQSEGGITGMSKTQLLKVLKGYEAGMQERKFNAEIGGKEAETARANAELPSVIAARNAQARLAEANALTLDQQRKTALENADVERRRLEANAREAEAKAAAAEEENADNDFLNIVTEPPAVTRERTQKRNVYGGSGSFITGFDKTGKPIRADVQLTPEQFNEVVDINGQPMSRSDALMGLLAPKKDADGKVIEAEGVITPEEEEDVAKVFGVNIEEAGKFKQELQNKVREHAALFGTTETEMATVLSANFSSPEYVNALTKVLRNTKDTPSIGAKLLRETNMGKGYIFSPKDADSAKRIAKHLASYFAQNQSQGQDDTVRGVNEQKSSMLVDVLSDYQEMKKIRAVEKAQVVKQEIAETVLDNVKDSEIIAGAHYQLASQKWREQYPNRPVPMNQIHFAAATLPSNIRVMEKPNPDGTVTRTTLINHGSIQNPQWKPLEPEGPKMTPEELAKQEFAMLKLNSLSFGGTTEDGQPVPEVYGDVFVHGKVRRMANPEKELSELHKMLAEYRGFDKAIEGFADEWDKVGALDVLPFSTRRKVMESLAAIYQMSNKEKLIGTGVVTQLDMEALKKAWQNPSEWTAWLNSGANREALKALQMAMRQNLTSMVGQYGLRVATDDSAARKARQAAARQAAMEEEVARSRER